MPFYSQSGHKSWENCNAKRKQDQPQWLQRRKRCKSHLLILLHFSFFLSFILSVYVLLDESMSVQCCMQKTICIKPWAVGSNQNSSQITLNLGIWISPIHFPQWSFPFYSLEMSHFRWQTLKKPVPNHPPVNACFSINSHHYSRVLYAVLTLTSYHWTLHGAQLRSQR